MAIIPRYILRLVLPYLALSAAVFYAVLFMNQFARVMGEAVKIGAPAGWIFYSMAQLAPGMLAMSLPMAFQTALLLAMGLMAERGELLALRAAGFSFRQITWPFGAASLALCGAMLWLNNFAAPEGFRRFRESGYAVSAKIKSLRIEPKTMLHIGQWQFYAAEADAATGALERVLLFKYPSGSGKANWTMRVSAPRGHYAVSPSGLLLELYDGEMQRVCAGDSSRTIIAEYGSYGVSIPPEAKLENRSVSLTEMSTPEIARGAASPQLTQRRRAEYRAEAAARLALTLSPLVFFCLGCPLAFAVTPKNRAWAMVLSIAILFGFYAATACGVNLGRRSDGPAAWWWPWLPDALGMAAGAALWIKTARR
ncbi:MAG: LptF/LptG family permease [Elusimicrobiales bacterium]